MPFEGRWHLLALCACLSAWAAAGNQPAVPLLLLIAYGLYLIFGGHYSLFAAFAALFLIIGTDVFFFQTNRTILSERQSDFEGTMEGSPFFDGNQLSFMLKTSSGEVVKTFVKLPSEEVKNKLSRSLRPGVICRLSGQLERPRAPSNFHAFDNRRYLALHHVYWELKANGPPICRDRSVSPADHLKRFRQDQINQINALFSPSSAEMINALVFGDDSGFDPELADAYRLFGLVHLLVVSGMHVTVIFGCLFFAARRLGMVREHIVILFLLLVPVYVIMTGAEPSIVRSGLTTCLFLASDLLKKRRLRTTDVISGACLIMIAWDPNVVFDLGFQLSFATTFAILIIGSQVIEKYRSPLIRIGALSMISELAAFPIVIFSFYQLSLISFFLSIFFVPFLTFVILPLSASAYLFSILFPSSAGFMSFVIDLFLTPPHQALLFLYRHPVLQLNYGSMSPWLLSTAVLIIYAILLIWERSSKSWTLPLLIFPFLLIYGIVVFYDWINPYGSVTFLDVGQGDSILIRLPHRQGNILIDSGGSLPYFQKSWEKRKKPFEVGRDVVLHELRAMGIGSLDAVVMTHSDFDHVGGMGSIIGQMPIKKIVISPYFNPDQTDIKLFRQAVGIGTKIDELKSGDRLIIGNSVFYVLSPLGRSNSNDNSLVLQTMLGGKSWVFTGDLGTDGERRLLAQYPSIRADVLKLGHHGSRNSSSENWLSQLNPSIAIVSAGKNNRYGHPHQDVLDRLQVHHTEVLRTDRSGALQFLFSKSRVVRIRTAAIQK
ncbi:DNA internalization-related competence protein ComEC/Rec2 [Sporolactobacillus putidus]|uniref:DNA internalization-related competence protein ComEC/Rec2 n=1 Tax=Sporolactobacillus putidus TaxID=492735 RepID=A0A917RWM7_9BACL|nr:DNA internalization-related competence protein ComEC/Rec2 [Sporolactobacillus putidus]GGL40493.1 DNA internalization-related competence protein ComEC/Rec2 [Sporolactobacillus putidus]